MLERRRLRLGPRLVDAGPEEVEVDFRTTGPAKLFGLRPVAASATGRRSASSADAQVDRADLAAMVLLELVSDPLVFAQAAHSGALDGGDVDEGVVAAFVGLDEAVATLAR